MADLSQDEVASEGDWTATDAARRPVMPQSKKSARWLDLHRLSELSTGVLASLIGGALLVLVGGSAAGIKLVNQFTNDNTQVVTGDAPATHEADPANVPTTRPRSKAAPAAVESPTATIEDPPTPAATARYDPSEDGARWIQLNSFEYFFDHQLYVTVGQLVTGTAVIDRVTIQEGAHEPCVFENVDGARFIMRRSEREYVVTFAKVNRDYPRVVDVNAAEFVGRQLVDTPCARLAG